ncbi:MAG: methyltransferase domain-containing protein [Muribaculaceae bacterium]
MQEDNASASEQSIHDFDFSLICDYFSTLKRQGPGSEATTLRALSFIDDLPRGTLVADLGCGTGSSALVLASHADVKVVALDLFPAFVGAVSRRAAEMGLADKVDARVGSMDALPFEPESLDMIWSEGAIYNVGFRHGLHLWHRYIKPGGYVAVTDATWLTPQRPAAIEQYWAEAYPEVELTSAKLRAMEEAGYEPVATFVLPSRCWTEEFYHPQRLVQEDFLCRHKSSPMAARLVANMRREAQMYDCYGRYYGYVFYIGRRL